MTWLNQDQGNCCCPWWDESGSPESWIISSARIWMCHLSCGLWSMVPLCQCGPSPSWVVGGRDRHHQDCRDIQLVNTQRTVYTVYDKMHCTQEISRWLLEIPVWMAGVCVMFWDAFPTASTGVIRTHSWKERRSERRILLTPSAPWTSLPFNWFGCLQKGMQQLFGINNVILHINIATSKLWRHVSLLTSNII